MTTETTENEGDSGAEAEIVVERDGPVAIVWFNRPDRRNAFNEALMARLLAALEGFARSWPEIRAVVFAGRGEGFSSGGDLNMLMRPRTQAELYDLRSDLARAFALIRSGPQAYVAAVHGYCVGSGLVLAGCCDFRICAESARFMFPEINSGYVPSIGIARIAHVMPDRLLRRLLMLGEPCTAAEAHLDGFATEIAADGEFLERAKALAGQLAAKPPQALRQSKRLANHVRQSAGEVAMDYESETYTALAGSEEVRERMGKFLARGKDSAHTGPVRRISIPNTKGK